MKSNIPNPKKSHPNLIGNSLTLNISKRKTLQALMLLAVIYNDHFLSILLIKIKFGYY